MGPEESPYAGGVFHLDIKFPKGEAGNETQHGSSSHVEPATLCLQADPAVAQTLPSVRAQSFLATSCLSTLEPPLCKSLEHPKFAVVCADYPFKPPKLRFKTRIYHCNVSSGGEICLDILKDKWSPALTLAKVLVSLSSLLTDPNPADPLEASIAQLLINDKAKHDNRAREYTLRHAST